MELHITCIPGDGIGPEIVAEAKKVLWRLLPDSLPAYRDPAYAKYFLLSVRRLLSSRTTSDRQSMWHRMHQGADQAHRPQLLADSPSCIPPRNNLILYYRLFQGTGQYPFCVFEAFYYVFLRHFIMCF